MVFDVKVFIGLNGLVIGVFVFVGFWFGCVDWFVVVCCVVDVVFGIYLLEGVNGLIVCVFFDG